MKLLIIPIAIALVMIAAPAYSQKKVTDILNDPPQREAVLDSIAANPALLQMVNEKAASKGANNMSGMDMGSDTSMMSMMMGNPSMMKNMMNMMMAQCAKDTAMCRNMCTGMMNNPDMMKMMREMMKNNMSSTDSTKGKMKMNMNRK